MQLIPFIAESAADAVTQIRARLGPDAVVVNIRPLPATGVSRFWRKPRFEVLAHQPEPTADRLNLTSDDPAVPGHTWTASPGVTFTSSALSAIGTPAGTFLDCVEVSRTPGMVRATYCRGVGLVREDVAYNGLTFVAQLSAKNF